MPKETLMNDLITIARALGEGSPIHGLIEYLHEEGEEITTLSVEVESDHAVFSYTSADGGAGQRRFDIESPTDQFKLDRFNVFIFGQPVTVDVAARRVADGTTTFHF